MINNYLIFIEFLKDNSVIFLAMVGIIGLMVGSFISVVAHRTPAIMMNEWRAEIGDFIAQDDALNGRIDNKTRQEIRQIYQSNQKLSLSYPHSHCPHCHHQIAWWQNIPIVSYALLSGRCASCQAGISPIYPAVELMSALLSVLVAYHFGASVQTALGLVLVWYLLALSLIDLKTQLLPDRLLVPLGVIGLLANLWGIFSSLEFAVWGLLAGFVAFWLINALFKLITGKDGMGLGDAKLLGVLGAWLGVAYLPMVVFIAALLGVAFGVIFKKYHQTFAFGPYLAVGGVIALIFGKSLLAWYLHGF